MLTEKELEIIKSLKWSTNRIIPDFKFERIIKSAKAPFRHKFWSLWKAKKPELKKLGYSIIRPDLEFHVVHETHKPSEIRDWANDDSKSETPF